MKKCMKRLCNLFLIMMSVVFVSNSASGSQNVNVSSGMKIQHQCDYDNECGIDAGDVQSCSVENLGLADPVDFYADFCRACYYEDDLTEFTDAKKKSVNCTEVLTCPEMPEVNVEEICSGLSGLAFMDCANNAMETAVAEAEANRCSYETSCKTGYENIKNNGQPNAYCDIITYNITYNNMDGAENSPNNPATYTVEDSVTFEDASKTGFTFGGWFLDSGYTSEITEIAQGTTGDKILYAKWTSNEYPITYKDGSQTLTGLSPTTYTYGVGATVNAVPTKTGYTFAGWCTDQSLTNCALAQSIGITEIGEKIFYASWTANNYVVKYDANNGSGVMADTTCTYDANCTLSYNSFTRVGYEFDGWNTAANGTGTDYNDGETHVNFTDESEITMFAKWKLVNYGIVYEVGCGANELQSADIPTKQYDVTTANIVLPTPTKDNYTFVGWCRSTDSEESCVPTKGNYTVPSGQTGKMVFYAVWTPVKIQITYHYNDTEEGQAEHVESDMCTVGQNFVLPAEEPTRSGYKFMGWRKHKSDCNYNCREETSIAM
nr:InlB B-repeat-containing protein [Candidatus Enterousia merdequi]